MAPQSRNPPCTSESWGEVTKGVVKVIQEPTHSRMISCGRNNERNYETGWTWFTERNDGLWWSYSFRSMCFEQHLVQTWSSRTTDDDYDLISVPEMENYINTSIYCRVQRSHGSEVWVYHWHLFLFQISWSLKLVLLTLSRWWNP